MLGVFQSRHHHSSGRSPAPRRWPPAAGRKPCHIPFPGAPAGHTGPPDTGPPDPGRWRSFEKTGRSHLCPVLQGKEDLGSALFKQLVPEGGLIGHHLVQQVLVVGQLPDELQDQRNIFLRANRNSGSFFILIPSLFVLRIPITGSACMKQILSQHSSEVHIAPLFLAIVFRSAVRQFAIQ